MKRSRHLWYLAPVALVGGLLFSSSGTQAQSYGRVLARAPMTVVGSRGDTLYLVSGPSLVDEAQLLASRLEDGAGSASSQFRPELRALSAGGQLTGLGLSRRVVTFSDPLTGEALHVDVMRLPGATGATYAAMPGTGVQVQLNPVNGREAVVEFNHCFYLLQLDSGAVRPLGDQVERKELWDEQRAEEAVAADAGHRDPIFASNPQWSPDGSMLAFLSNRAGEAFPGLYVLDVASGSETRVYQGEEPYSLLGWSDETHILLQLRPRTHARTSILSVDILSGEPESLGQGEVLGRSRSGRQLILQDQTATGTRLTRLELSGGTLSEVAGLEPGVMLRSGQVALSADERLLATDLTDAAGRQWIAVLALDGSSQKRVSLPPGMQLSGPVQWAGAQLVVPLENLSTRVSETLLMPVR